MHAWADTVEQFADAIRNGSDLAPHVANSAGYPLMQGVEIYRNNFRGNLHDTLATAYPVIVELVGPDFFKWLARKFIEQYPSRSGNLHRYGSEMADFLAHLADVRHLPYLPDVAQLEWACHRAYYTEDAAPLDVDRLHQIVPEDYANLRWQLHPACALISSRYPIAVIWQAHQADASGDFRIDLADGGDNVLVTRNETGVQVTRISPDRLFWLQQLQHGATLGAACEITLSTHPEFDLTGALMQEVTQGVLIDFSVAQGE